MPFKQVAMQALVYEDDFTEMRSTVDSVTASKKTASFNGKMLYGSKVLATYSLPLNLETKSLMDVTDVGGLNIGESFRLAIFLLNWQATASDSLLGQVWAVV